MQRINDRGGDQVIPCFNDCQMNTTESLDANRLKMRCLSKHPPSTPPYLGYITLRVGLDVKLVGAWRLCLGSGH